MQFPTIIGICGQVKVHVGQKRTNQSYECAAWWQITMTDTGVFDVGLQREEQGHYTLVAIVPATVTDADFTSHFGGLAYGKYDKSRDVGRRVKEYLKVSAIKAIEQYGNSPGMHELQWIFDPQYWGLVREQYEVQMKDAVQRVKERYDGYKAGKEFDLSMVAHYGSILETSARSIEKIDTQIGYNARSGFSGQHKINNDVGPSLTPLHIVDAVWNSSKYKRFSLDLET